MEQKKGTVRGIKKREEESGAGIKIEGDELHNQAEKIIALARFSNCNCTCILGKK